MGYRHLCLIAIIAGFSTSASAKSRDFQFMDDLTFSMPGEFSITQGLTRAESRRVLGKDAEALAMNSQKAKSVVPTQVTYGVNERFEISLEVPYVFLDNTATDYDGLGDVTLGQKFQLTDQAAGRSWLSSALGFKFEAPTGDDKKGLGNGKTDVELFGVGMKEIGFTKWLANVGYNFVGGEKYSNEFKYNGGVNASIHPGFSFLMEFNGVAGTKDEVYLAPGFLVETRGVVFRLGTQFGMNDESYKYRWTFNLSNSF